MKGCQNIRTFFQEFTQQIDQKMLLLKKLKIVYHVHI